MEPDALPVGVTHLLAADDALDEQFQCRVYAAVCGQLVSRSDLPSWECPQDCECDLAVYCPQCVSQAAESSALAQPGPDTQQDDSRKSYYLGECGHQVPAESGVSGLFFRVGPCSECEEEPSTNDPQLPMTRRTTPEKATT